MIWLLFFCQRTFHLLQTIEVSLNWTRLNTQPILGNETDVTSNVNVMVDADMVALNDVASIVVQFSAVADLTITSV